MSTDCTKSGMPLSPSDAYRLQLAQEYRRVVLCCGSHIEWARMGAMTQAERTEHERVWMAYQNQELFKPLFERDDVTPPEVHGLAIGELVPYLMADHEADKLLDRAIRAAARLGGDAARQLLPMLKAVRRKRAEAGMHSDKHRYAQAAELEYLSPLAWRK